MQFISKFSFTVKKLMDNQKLRLFDIAANLTDDQFDGQYHGKKYHESDVNDVIERASKVGCDHLLIASGYLPDLIHALELCKLSDKFFTTGGVHPCRAAEITKNGGKEIYFQNLKLQIEEGIKQKKMVAIGECGLDYDRFHYSTKEEQLLAFPPHFDLAEKYNLPLYLHNRNTGNDFFELVEANRSRFTNGVVHSFTGTIEEMEKIIKLDLFIGINGASLRTEEQINIAKQIPLNKLMIETDSPYCEIKNTHASAQLTKTKFQFVRPEKFKKGLMVKSRNEPCTVVQVLEVLAHARGIDQSILANACFENSLKFFQILK